MKEFTEPKMEIIAFEDTDIITSSLGCGNEEPGRGLVFGTWGC